MLLVHGFAAFHMPASGQSSIKTEAGIKFAVACINKRLVCKSYTDSDIIKMEEQLYRCRYYKNGRAGDAE